MKFLFDHNISPYLARAINELSRPHGIAVFAKEDMFPRDTPDTEWINALAKEGDWTCISHDRFSKNNLEKEALRRSGLIVFILAKGWSDQRQWEKAALLVRWWPRIIEQAGLVQGGAVFEVPVRFSGKGKFQQIKF